MTPYSLACIDICMGTNYYIKCDECGHERHVGKSSVGWQFLFEKLEQYGSVKELREYIRDHKVTLVDEYGKTLSLDELLRKVETKKRDRCSEGAVCDEEGYQFYDREFS